MQQQIRDWSVGQQSSKDGVNGQLFLECSFLHPLSPRDSAATVDSCEDVQILFSSF